MLQKSIISLGLITILFFVLYSCKSNEGKPEFSEIDYRSGTSFPNFKEKNTGLGRLIHRDDTLKIIIEFSDCGEWGGRRESVFIHCDTNGKISARFTMDSVSCKNLKNIGGYAEIDDNSRVVIKDTTKLLSKANEELINLFIHRLLEIYLNQEDHNGDSLIYIYADSGTRLKIANSDSTLNLEFWNIDSMANTWYGYVRSRIFNEKPRKFR
jgi:hypothetical protein